LWIHVNDKNAMTLTRKMSSKIASQCGLAYATFVIKKA